MDYIKFDIIIKSFKGVNMKKFFIILAKIFLIILEIIIHILGFQGACIIVTTIITYTRMRGY